MKDFYEKFIKKNQQKAKDMQNYPACKELQKFPSLYNISATSCIACFKTLSVLPYSSSLLVKRY